MTLLLINCFLLFVKGITQRHVFEVKVQRVKNVPHDVLLKNDIKGNSSKIHIVWCNLSLILELNFLKTSMN